MPDGFVGSAKCRGCHEDDWQRWSSSHHAKAMLEPSDSSVIGDFHDVRFDSARGPSLFHRGAADSGDWLVEARGPHGERHDYPVRYVFGIDPLQQLLLELPGGRLQAYPVAWDARPKERGGQRWFDLAPGDASKPGDALDWTGYMRNWNLQCASCHSTALRKNLDVATKTYATTFAEINVACEACHGPGAKHVEWAASAKPPFGGAASEGLAVVLPRWSRDAWQFAAPTVAIASRTSPPTEAQTTTCAPCHSRRSLLKEDAPADASLYESARPQWISEPSYYGDGQQHDEVYVWGSFLLSKMSQRGVVCADCHDSHSLALRADGNALCTRCHRSEVFDVESHHHHDAASTGARCVECHMPETTYMGVDARRDHLIQVPRPDLDAEARVPDACTRCHAGKTAAWAVDAMDRFYGPQWRRRPSAPTTLASAAKRGAVGAAQLLALAEDKSQPSLLRASAVAAAENGAMPASVTALGRLLRDDDAGVRLASLDLLGGVAPAQAPTLASPLLDDPVRTVRITAAALLADAPDAAMTAAARASRDRELAEYVASQQLNADQPFADVNLGNLRARQHRQADSRAAFEAAIAIDPADAAAYVNLADVDRAFGDEAGCRDVLARGLKALPDSAALRHARGLALVRDGRAAEALADLEAAARLDAGAARYAYVYGVALHSLGRSADAVSVLERAESAHPYDVEILQALVEMLATSGHDDEALGFATKLAQALPGDPDVARMIAALQAAER